jgi:hypothetical protein
MIRDIGVISKKKMMPNTIGLTISPSSNPNLYQSRLSGLSNQGEISVTAAKITLRKSSVAANSFKPIKKEYIAKVIKTPA